MNGYLAATTNRGVIQSSVSFESTEEAFNRGPAVVERLPFLGLWEDVGHQDAVGSSFGIRYRVRGASLSDVELTYLSPWESSSQRLLLEENPWQLGSEPRLWQPELCPAYCGCRLLRQGGQSRYALFSPRVPEDVHRFC